MRSNNKEETLLPPTHVRELRKDSYTYRIGWRSCQKPFNFTHRKHVPAPDCKSPTFPQASKLRRKSRKLEPLGAVKWMFGSLDFFSLLLTWSPKDPQRRRRTPSSSPVRVSLIFEWFLEEHLEPWTVCVSTRREIKNPCSDLSSMIKREHSQRGFPAHPTTRQVLSPVAPRN